MEEYSPWKAVHHSNRIESLKNGLMPAPTHIVLSPVNYCNHSCPHCFVNHLHEKRALMETSNIFKIITDAKSIGTHGIQLTGGGEPSLHPDFWNIVDHIRETELELGLITNGSMIKRSKHIEKLSFATWIRLSLDGLSADTYKSTHGVSFSKERDKILNELCSISETTIGASYVVLNNNFHEIFEFAQWAKEIGFDYVRFTPGQAAEGSLLSEENLDTSLNNIAKAIDLSDGKFKVFGQTQRIAQLKNPKRNFRECWWQHFAPFIDHQGNLYPCCETQGVEKTKMGNVLETPLRELWYSRTPIKLCQCPMQCLFTDKNEFVDYLTTENPPHVNFV